MSLYYTILIYATGKQLCTNGNKLPKGKTQTHKGAVLP